LTTIFHITKLETWNKAKAQGAYDFCTLTKDGFIHASTKEQYLNTAQRLFRDLNESLVLLEINEDLLDAKVIYENLEGGQELFPHIYGPIQLSAITNIHNLEKNQAGDFIPIT